jgi:hypothetical protein
MIVRPSTAPAGDEPGEEEVPRRERERRGHGRDDVDPQGEHEQLLAAEPVGQLAEEQGTQAGPDDIERSGDADAGRGRGDAAAVLGQAGCHRADDRDLETVQARSRSTRQ